LPSTDLRRSLIPLPEVSDLRVELQLHLIRMRAVADLVAFLVYLGPDSLLRQVLREDLVDQQEVVILLQRLQSLLQGAGQRLDLGLRLIAPREDIGVDGTEPGLGRIDLVKDTVDASHELRRQS